MNFKKLLIFPLILTLFGTSCSNNEKIYVEQKENIDSFVYLSNQELTSLINNKQDFVLVVGENGCSTCELIKPVIIDYLTKYEYIIYWIENRTYQTVVDKFIDSDGYSLKANIDSASILLFNNGKTKEVIEYNQNLYFSDSKFELTLENKITGSHLYSLNNLTSFSYSPKQKMYRVDLSLTEELDTIIASNNKSMILYSWGPCPDCIRIKEELLKEYLVSTKKKLYVFEVSHFRNDYSSNPTLFNEFASKYKFNTYRGGKVPALCLYKNNELVNMHVYYNDEFVKNEDQSYTITNSYIPELINTNYSSGNAMFDNIAKIHTQKTIEYLDKNL